MNKFLLTLAMLFAAMTVGVHAQKKVNRMVVHQKDGAEKTYVLENMYLNKNTPHNFTCYQQMEKYMGYFMENNFITSLNICK